MTHNETEVPTIRQRAKQLLKDLEMEEQVSVFLDVFETAKSDIQSLQQSSVETIKAESAKQ